MTRATAALVVFALASVVGCGYVETHEALLRAPAPPGARPAELYMADQRWPARPFVEIALVQATGFGSGSDPEEVAHALATKAARLGCDAVLRTHIDQGYTRTNATGVCVRWLAPGPPAPSPALPSPRGARPPPVRPAPAPAIEPLPSTGLEPGGRS